MPAIIQNTPVFTPFSFEQYVAPLNTYKQEYDAIEKQYNEVEAAASALEALAADAPNSQAYRTYRDYIDGLRAEADALAYNGLTPGSRQRLRNIRTGYTSNIVPIVRGMEKWEKDKERYYNLKDHEIMSIDPFEHNAIDKYIGNNPSSRILNLETVRKNALLTGQAWSDRVFGDLSPLVLQGVLDGGYTLLSQLQGFVSGGPNGQDSLTELLNAEQALKSGDPAYSEGIRLLRNQLESLGFEQFDVQGQKQILNSVLLGYGQGLQGKYEYRNVPYTTQSSGGSGSPIVKGIPAVHSQTIPLAEHSEKAKENILDLGATYDNSTRTYTFDPTSSNAISKLDLWLGTVSTGRNASSPIYVPIQTAVENYQGIMSGEYTYEHNGRPHAISNSQKKKLQNVVEIIDTYQPEIAKQIKDGTFNGNIKDVISNIVTQVTTTTLDYGTRLFNITYSNDNDVAVLSEALKRYIKSNDGKFQTMDLSADGKTFAPSTDEDINDKAFKPNNNQNPYSNISIKGVSFLPTDSSYIIVNTEINGEPRQIKVPTSAINDQAMQALDVVNQHALAFNQFEAEHGTFDKPQPGGTPSDMENIWMEIRKVDEQYETKNTSRENELAYHKAVFEALEDLATTHGKEKDYYTKLFQQYQQLEYATSMMYPQFVQNFGYAIGTVDNQDYKQNTYHEVVTGTKQK